MAALLRKACFEGWHLGTWILRSFPPLPQADSRYLSCLCKPYGLCWTPAFHLILEFWYMLHRWWASQVVLVVKNPPASTGDIKDAGLIPGLERSPGAGNGYPLQYSCLENSVDRGAWWAIVRGVTNSRTWLKQLHTHTHTHTHTEMVPARPANPPHTYIYIKSKLLGPPIIMGCNPSGFSVHGILQAKILEWVAMPSFRGSSWPRDQTCIFYVSCISR